MRGRPTHTGKRSLPLRFNLIVQFVAGEELLPGAQRISLFTLYFLFKGQLKWRPVPSHTHTSFSTQVSI